MDTQRWDACSPECPGWGLFNLGSATESIQRCDECARFPDDLAAAEHVARLWPQYFDRAVPWERLVGAGRLESSDLWRIRRLHRRDQFQSRLNHNLQS
jgi:hypothetical protein